MNILVGYDGSSPSKLALDRARKHAAAFSAHVDIVTVVVRHSTDQSEEIQKAEKALEIVQKNFEDKNISCRTKLIIRAMEAGEALVEFASKNMYEELIIGIKKTSKFEKLLLGSNAQFMILNAPCPVLSVRDSK